MDVWRAFNILHSNELFIKDTENNKLVKTKWEIVYQICVPFQSVPNLRTISKCTKFAYHLKVYQIYVSFQSVPNLRTSSNFWMDQICIAVQKTIVINVLIYYGNS